MNNKDKEMHPVRALFCAILAFLFVSFLCWLGGFEWDHRCFEMAMWFLISFLFAVVAFVATAFDPPL